MKKWFALVLVLCIAAAVQAQDEGKKEAAKKKAPANITKAKFVKKQEAMAEKKGVEFDQDAAEAKFDKMDKNKDGILTPDERGKGRNEGKKEKKDKDSDESEGTTDSE